MPKRGGDHKIFGIGLGALSLGAVASAAAGGYKIAEFLVHAKKLHEVNSENKVFVRLIERVRLDLAEVDRLLKLPAVKHSLRNNPKKVAWIRNSVRAMNMALEQLAEFSGGVDSDTKGGKHAGLWTRMKWVMDEHEKLVHRQMEVNLSHQGIIAVLQFLGALEPMNCCEEEPVTGALPYGMQREDIYGGFASQARAMAQLEDEPGRESIRVRKEDVYESDEPARESIRVKEKDVYERDGSVREKVEVREKNVYERDEPTRERVQVRERSKYGREAPPREKTKYGWDEPLEEKVEVRETTTYGREDARGPIRMQDNDTVRSVHTNSFSLNLIINSSPSIPYGRQNFPSGAILDHEKNYQILTIYLLQEYSGQAAAYDLFTSCQVGVLVHWEVRYHVSGGILSLDVNIFTYDGLLIVGEKDPEVLPRFK
jgi:hypothetical protein